VLGTLTRLKDRGTAWLRGQRARREWLDHLVRAGSRYKGANGDFLAAGVTYFSFLSLFPVLLLGMSVAGFVLKARQDLQTQLQNAILEAIPGTFGATLVDAVQAAVKQRGTLGVVALLGVAYAGLGWVGNLRKATMLVWGTAEQNQPNPVAAKASDLVALAGVGLAAALSLSLTATATAATGWLLRRIGLDGVTGMGTLSRVVVLSVAAAGDTLVFGWLLARLPRAGVPYRSVLKGALFAAVGFGLLKVIGTYYVQRVSQSPTAGLFGNVIGILVWLNLVSRFLIYAAAWTATDRIFTEGVLAPLLGLATEQDAGEPVSAAADPPSEPRPVAVAGALLGTGAALGAAAVLATRLRAPGLRAPGLPAPGLRAPGLRAPGLPAPDRRTAG
jgi:membrane protein